MSDTLNLTTHCPYLGLRKDPATWHGYPTESNLCHKCKPARQAAKSYQASTCLTAEHASCQVFNYQGKWPKSLPAHISKESGDKSSLQSWNTEWISRVTKTRKADPAFLDQLEDDTPEEVIPPAEEVVVEAPAIAEPEALPPAPEPVEEPVDLAPAIEDETTILASDEILEPEAEVVTEIDTPAEEVTEDLVEEETYDDEQTYEEPQETVETASYEEEAPIEEPLLDEVEEADEEAIDEIDEESFDEDESITDEDESSQPEYLEDETFEEPITDREPAYEDDLTFELPETDTSSGFPIPLFLIPVFVIILIVVGGGAFILVSGIQPFDAIAGVISPATETPQPTPTDVPPTPTTEPTSTPTPEPPTVTPTPEPIEEQPTNTPEPAPTEPLPEDVLIGIIEFDSNLRAGPGVDYDIIDLIPGGTEVAILGRDRLALWAFIRLETGLEGWVSATQFVEDLDMTLLPLAPGAP